MLVLVPYNMNIFELPEEENITDRIDLDELYDRKREYDESKLVTYNKILSRVHTKIKTTSRQSIHERCCWYIIPEIMIGITRYNVEECTSFLLTKLSDNGFQVKYTHPNLLFICWNHWIPDYVRKEMKKKTGIEIDGYGNEVHKGKGGLASKKSSFSFSTHMNHANNQGHQVGRLPRGTNEPSGARHYHSDQYPPVAPSDLSNPYQRQTPSMNSLVLSTPKEVTESYRNPLSSHKPFQQPPTSPSNLKYDPNNHSVSYEPYKMNYMTSTSTKNDNSSDDNNTMTMRNDTQKNEIGSSGTEAKGQHSVTFDIPSNKRDPPEYKSVRTYKPSGIYSADMFSQLKSKLK